MPIEDVQHLLRNSVQDSSLVFVDSALRDAVHYPTSSEFVVDLDEPVRNVFGIDVLDAAVSNVMYNVDFNNNVLRLLLVDTAGSALLQAARASMGLAGALAQPGQVDAADALDLELLNRELGGVGLASPLRAWLADAPAGASYHVSVVDAASPSVVDPGGALSWAPTAPEAGASLRVDGAAPPELHLLLLESRTEGVPLSAAAAPPAGAEPGAWVPYGGAWYGPAAAQADAAVLGLLAQLWQESVATTGGTGSGGKYAVLPSPAGAEAGYAAAPDARLAPALYDVVTFRAVRLTPSQHATLFGGWGAPAVGGPPRRLALRLCAVGIEKGNYATAAALQAGLQDAFDAARVPVIADSTSASAGINKQGVLRLTSNTNTRVLFCSTESTAATLLGFTVRTQVTTRRSPPASARVHGGVVLGGSTVPAHASVLREDTMQLDAPGVINLLGVRYVTLRCAEIEQHIGSTGKYGRFSTGVGVFKLLSTNEMVQVRFDFVNLVRRPFHPIAKLARLTLRFELPDGSLYDFKGVDNQMLLTLKYYAPVPGGDARGTPPFPSVLNPDYDPDFMRFVATRDAFAAGLHDAGRDDADADAGSDSDRGEERAAAAAAAASDADADAAWGERTRRLAATITARAAASARATAGQRRRLEQAERAALALGYRA